MQVAVPRLEAMSSRRERELGGTLRQITAPMPQMGPCPPWDPPRQLRALQPLPDGLKSSTTERVPARRRKGRTPQLAPAISPNVLRAARSDSDIAPSCQPARQPGNPPDESRSWPSQTRAADLPGRESGAVEHGVLPYGVLQNASRRSCMPF